MICLIYYTIKSNANSSQFSSMMIIMIMMNKQVISHISFSLFFYEFEIQIRNDHTDVVPTELEIGQISYFWCILLISIVFLPSGFALIHEGSCCCLLILVLIDKTTHLSRTHHIPTPIRTNHYEFVSLFELEVLDLRLRD